MAAVETRRLAVVGNWHQASVVSACLAALGYQVTGIGDDAEAIAALNAGRAPLYEPGLNELIDQNLRADRLRYTVDYAQGLAGVEVCFLCIDTPVGAGDTSDLTTIEAAVEAIGSHASGPFVLAVSAQVPIGTCDRMNARLATHYPTHAIPVAYVPEFLRLGTAIRSFREADRFVIGADDTEVAERVAAIYQPLGRPIRLTDRLSAEMAKHASNAFLATSISFINQIADLCEETGADVTEVAAIMKLDARVGPHAFLGAGLGYAGGTLGREIRALQKLGKENGIDTGFLDSVAHTNDRRVPRLVQRLKDALGPLQGAQIAVLGLTYKPGTSTLRRSAALELIDQLTGAGAQVRAFDPLARLAEVPDLPAFELSPDPMAAVSDASAVILIAPWENMAQFDFAAAADAMQRPLLMDSGNYLSPVAMVRAGFSYVGVGRGEARGVKHVA